MSIRLTLIVIAAANLFLSCSSPHHVIKELTLSSDEVIARVEQRKSSIKTLKGSGSITIESNETSLGGSFELNLKKPDSMRVELRGPFGIRIGTLMLSGEQFLFYNRRENAAITGKADSTTLESLLHINLRFNEIKNAFAGELPLNIQHDSLLKFYTDENSYVFIYRNENETKEYYVDGNNFITTTLRTLDEQGNVSMTASASDIEETNGIASPKFMRMFFQKERRGISVEYSNLHINEPVECSFIPPKSAQIIIR